MPAHSHTYDEATALLDAIWSHPLYRAHYRQLAEYEASRPFCCHQLPHLMDAARIAYIENLERELGFSRVVVYAAALLHDIGKDEQYRAGVPHEEAGARIAREILDDIATGGSVPTSERGVPAHEVAAPTSERGVPAHEVAAPAPDVPAHEVAAPAAPAPDVPAPAAPALSPEEADAIIRAIREHRRCPDGSSELGRLLYRADKASRACFACEMLEECSWPEEKMNLRIGV